MCGDGFEVWLVLMLQLQRRAEQMKKNLEQQEKELEEKIKTFEAEREAWEEQNKFDDQYASFHCSHYTSVIRMNSTQQWLSHWKFMTF